MVFFQLGRDSEGKMRNENRENKERKSHREIKLEKEEKILCVMCMCVQNFSTRGELCWSGIPAQRNAPIN